MSGIVEIFIKVRKDTDVTTMSDVIDIVFSLLPSSTNLQKCKLEALKYVLDVDDTINLVFIDGVLSEIHPGSWADLVPYSWTDQSWFIDPRE